MTLSHQIPGSPFRAIPVSSPRSAGSNDSGTLTSGWKSTCSVPANRGGVTPTIVKTD